MSTTSTAVSDFTLETEERKEKLKVYGSLSDFLNSNTNSFPDFPDDDDYRIGGFSVSSPNNDDSLPQTPNSSDVGFSFGETELRRGHSSSSHDTSFSQLKGKLKEKLDIPQVLSRQKEDFENTSFFQGVISDREIYKQRHEACVQEFENSRQTPRPHAFISKADTSLDSHNMMVSLKFGYKYISQPYSIAFIPLDDNQSFILSMRNTKEKTVIIDSEHLNLDTKHDYEQIVQAMLNQMYKNVFLLPNTKKTFESQYDDVVQAITPVRDDGVEATTTTPVRDTSAPKKCPTPQRQKNSFFYSPSPSPHKTDHKVGMSRKRPFDSYSKSFTKRRKIFDTDTDKADSDLGNPIRAGVDLDLRGPAKRNGS